MSRGTKILLENREYRGKLWSGKIAASETPYPGTVVQIQASSIPALTAAPMYTFEIYNADADGGRPKGPYIVLLEDRMLGRTMSTIFAAGEQCKGYTPLPGDELNMLYLNIAGTADDHTKGEVAIVDDTTGKLIATTGSPETEVAMIMETVTDPTADFLAHVVWTGY